MERKPVKQGKERSKYAKGVFAAERLIVLALTIALIISLIPFSALADSETESTPPVYQVQFLDYDGSVLSTQPVNENAAAVAPSPPAHEGKNFIGWDKDFSVIVADLVVTALYEDVPPATETVPPASPDSGSQSTPDSQPPSSSGSTDPETIYTVRFFAGDTELVDFTQEIPAGGLIANLPPAPDAEEGYTFKGWADRQAGDGVVIENLAGLAVSKNMEFVAVFEIAQPASQPEPSPITPANVETITVTFDPANQSQPVFTQDVAVGGFANEPAPPIPNPSIQQTAFIGWFAGGAETPFDFASTPINQPITLTARYSENFLVKYKSAAGGDELVIDSIELEPGEPVPHTAVTVVPPANSFIEYWYIEGESDAVPFIFGQPATRDLTLVPKFSNEYYVFFISEGTEVPFIVVTGGDKADKPADPTRAGYSFTHWSQTKNGAAFDFNTPITADTTLYAVWAPKTVEYTVVYWLEKANISGDPGTAPSNYEFYKEQTKTALAGTQVNFAGGAGLDTVQYATFSHSPAATISGNGTTVVNVYFKRIVYTITFDLNQTADTSTVKNNYASLVIGGQTYTGTSYKVQAKFEQDISAVWPTYPNAMPTQTAETWKNNKKTGTKTYAFTGWQPPSSLTNTNWVTRRLTLTSDMIPSSGTGYTVTARWEDSAVSYTVNYWFEQLPGETGETGSYSGKTYVKSTLYSQVFYTNNNLSPKLIAGVEYVGNNNSGTVYNFYYNRLRYNLSFNTAGGSTIAPVNSIMYGAGLAGYAPAAAPTRAGYTFEGWYLDADYYLPFSFSAVPVPTMPNHNMALFAKWESTANTVRFYDDFTDNNLLDTIGCATNDYVVDPLIYAEGQTVAGKGMFDGWYIYITSSRMAKFSFDTPVTHDLKLYAAWRTNGFKLTYSAGAGSGTVPVDGDSYYVGKQARLADGSSLTPPAGKDFFVGWKVQGDTSGQIYYPGTVFVVNGDVTLVAEYGKQSDYITLVFHSNYPQGTNTTISWKVARNSTTTLAGALFSYPNSTILGWSTTPGATTPQYQLSQPNVPTGTANIDLYAVWKFSGYTITFTAGPGGGLKAGDTALFEHITAGSLWADAITAVPGTVPENGKYFAGWDPALPTGTTPINQSQTYTAVFRDKAEITITAQDKTVVYNGLLQSVSSNATLTSGALLPGHTLAVASGTGSGKDVTTNGYPINVTSLVIQDASGNPVNVSRYYNVTYVKGTLHINPKAITITAQNAGKIYGAADPATLAATVSGAAAGDTLNYTVSRTPGENAGSYPITVAAGINPNYTITTVPGVFTIAPKSADVLIMPISTGKVYGDVNPPLTATVTGTVGSDQLNYTLVRTPGENAGSYEISVVLGQNPNYSIQTTTAVFTIAQRPATIAAQNAGKIYGEADPAALLADVSGTVNGDTLNYTVSRAPGEDAGTYAITITQGTNPNYAITAVPGVFTIAPKAVDVLITPVNSSKVYGETDPQLTATVTGTVGGDQLNYTLKRAAGEGVGSYEISVVLGENPNYTIQTATGSFAISPRPATITAQNAGKIYGEADPAALLANVSGTVNGDTLNYTVSRTPGEDAGVYEIAVSAGMNPNYSVTVYPGTFTIAPKSTDVLITPVNGSKVYGETDPLLTATVTGTVGSDQIDYTLVRTPGEDANTYTISVELGQNPNYTIQTTTAVFTIEKRPATITAQNAGKIYGEADPAALLANVSGTVNGDTLNYTVNRAPGEDAGTYGIDITQGANPNYTVTAVPGVFTIAPKEVDVLINPVNSSKMYGQADPMLTATITGTVGDDQLDYTLVREPGEGAGSYAITVQLGQNPNYVIQTGTATFTIEKRPVTITAQSAGKIYGQSDPAAWTAVITGMVNGDELDYIETRVPGENAGSYPITIALGNNPNYIVTVVQGTFTIAPKSTDVLIVADNTGKVYGETDPQLTATEYGTVGQDHLNYTLVRQPGEDAGSYEITIQLGDNPNYQIQTTTAAFTIEKRPATITAQNTGKIYGEADPTLPVAITGTVGEDTLAYTISRAPGEDSATYAITVTPGDNPNYEVTAVPGEFTIARRTAEVMIMPNNAGKVYGSADPALTAAVTGTVGEDQLNYTLVRAAGENVGNYPITVQLGENPNYDIQTSEGVFAITPANATITANNATKVQGSSDPALTGTVAGAIGSDTLAYSLQRTAGEMAGSYTITVIPGANPNYQITTVPGTFTITAPYIPNTPDTPVTPETPPTPIIPTRTPVIPEQFTPAPVLPPDKEAPAVVQGNASPPKEILSAGQVPLAVTPPKAEWALMNLMLTIVTAIITMVLLAGYLLSSKKKNDDSLGDKQQEVHKKVLFRLLSILPTALAVIVFIITQDMSNPMVLVDSWTWLMAVITAVQLLTAMMARKTTHSQEPESHQNA